MSRLFDWLFPPQNRDQGRHAYDQEIWPQEPPTHPRGFFGEIDRIMQEMMQEHFQNMNLHFTPSQHNFQIEDRSEENVNLRDRMLKKPEREYDRFQREQNIISPNNKDINLDNAIQDNPGLIDQLFHEKPTHPTIQPLPREIEPFSPRFSPENRGSSPGNYTFSSQTTIVTRGSDGQLRFHKKEIHEDAHGNRQVIESSSDDKDNVGGQYLQDNQHIRPPTYPGSDGSQDGVFQRIRRWFYPPTDD